MPFGTRLVQQVCERCRQIRTIFATHQLSHLHLQLLQLAGDVNKGVGE